MDDDDNDDDDDDNSDQVGNKGAYINLTKKSPSDQSERPELEYDYVTFEAVPHPSVKPMQYANGGMRGMF